MVQADINESSLLLALQDHCEAFYLYFSNLNLLDLFEKFFASQDNDRLEKNYYVC